VDRRRRRSHGRRRPGSIQYPSHETGAEAELEALARQLTEAHPGAAASLREGLAATLTVSRLGVPPTLARTLRSTNAIESMIEICRDHSSNVKRWRDGQMVLRWCAAGMLEASKQFRRVNGFMHLPALRKALDAHVAGTVTAHAMMTTSPPEHHRAATEVPRNSGHPRRASPISLQRCRCPGDRGRAGLGYPDAVVGPPAGVATTS
jgi:hypothetical protein